MRSTGSLIVALTVLLAFACASAKKKECTGEDLPADGKLGIGVKFRPEECTLKSKRGDTLSMHYTGEWWERNAGNKFEDLHQEMYDGL